jgi:hypothetical protein
MNTVHTFLHSDLCGAGLWLLLCRGLFVLLHAPYLIFNISYLECLNRGSTMLTLIMVVVVWVVAGIKTSESMRGSSRVCPVRVHPHKRLHLGFVRNQR